MHDHPSNHRFFFYGTLMSRGLRGGLLREVGEPIARATIRGKLYAVTGGGFPCLTAGDGVVTGEVWQAYDALSLRIMTARADTIEGYNARSHTGMYLRERHPLLAVEPVDGREPPADLLPGAHVWTYRWNYSDLGDAIPSGDWREYREERDAWREQVAS